MSQEKTPKLGSIGWVDLTVEDGESIRDFYHEVAGWRSEAFDMGGYEDYVMMPPSHSGNSEPVAGVCHARGGNAGLPPCWLVYIVVEDLDESLESCVDLGGEVIQPVRSYGAEGRFAVVRDPAGAACALYEVRPPMQAVSEISG